MEQEDNKFPHNLKVGDKVLYTTGYFRQYKVVTIVKETKTKFILSNKKEIDKGKTCTRDRNNLDKGYIEELTPEKIEQIRENNLRVVCRAKIYNVADEIKKMANDINHTSSSFKRALDKLEEVKQILEKQ